MRIAIGNDHHGVARKNEIISFLKSEGINYTNYGTDSSETCDYVDYAQKVCKSLQNGENDLGILICKTGIGMSIVANKFKGIRCARIFTAEDAFLSKSHNNSNIIAISENIQGEELIKIIKTFIDTPFSTEERHIRRVEKIENISNN